MFRELATVAPNSMEFQRQRDKIVERCLPLADHIARRFEGRGEPRDDLVQVARVGLVNAVVRFDVDAGSDFVSFAVPTIMGEVRRHFRDNSWSVKVPRRLQELDMARKRADAEGSIPDRHPAQFREIADVDHDLGRNQAKIHRRQKALSPRQQPCLLPVHGKHFQRTLDAGCACISESRSFHGRDLPEAIFARFCTD